MKNLKNKSNIFRHFDKAFKKIGLLILSIIFSLLIGEIILRTLYPFSIEYYVWPPCLHKVFKPIPNIMPGIYGDSRFITNSKGIRGNELSHRQSYRILAIGGSTTECLYLDQTETWPYLLENILNENLPNGKIWVGNVGRSALTTRHHILEMKYLLPQYPKIDTIIMLVGVCDFHNRLTQDVKYDPHFMSLAGSELRLMHNTFYRYPIVSAQPFYKKTAIWNLIKEAIILINKREYTQDMVGEFYVTMREQRRKAKEIRNVLPDMLGALEEYAKNINTIIDQAQKGSIRLIFVTQPTMWKGELVKELDDLLWYGFIRTSSGGIYYSTETLSKGISLYNKTLQEVCRKRKVKCFDLAAFLPKDTSVFYDDAHFNENGARKVAEAIAKYMLDLEPFKGTKE